MEVFTKRQRSRINELKLSLVRYEKGELSESRLRTYYNSLRAIVNRRIKTMADAGMQSRDLDEVYVYLDMAYESEYFIAPRKRNITEIVRDYKKMIDFAESPFSVKKGYEFAEAITTDFEKGGLGDISDKTEFIKYIANGDFADLVKAVGNSSEAYKDIEGLINEGITAEQLRESFSAFIEGTGGYDAALRKAMNNLRE